MGIRETVLAAKVPTEVVRVQTLGIDITVRGMTGRERDAFESSCFEGTGRHRKFTMNNLRAKMVAFCCLNPDGSRAFTDADADALGDAPSEIVDQLFTVAQRLSGMNNEDVDELGKRSAIRAASDTPSSPSPVSLG